MEKALEEHSTKTDARFYNGGTIAVLAFASIAATISAFWPAASAVAGGFSAAAAFLVALERSLNWGGVAPRVVHDG